HYVPGTEWRERFDRRLNEDRPPTLTVGLLRQWTNEPRPMGLPREVQDLVILTYAAETDRVLIGDGQPQTGEIGRGPDDWQLHQEKLPDSETWQAAVQRAGAIFGMTASPVPTAAAVATLVSSLKGRAKDARAAVVAYDDALRARLTERGLSVEVDRART